MYANRFKYAYLIRRYGNIFKVYAEEMEIEQFQQWK